MKKLLIFALMILFAVTSNVSATPLDKSIMSAIIGKTQTSQMTDQIIVVIDHN